MGATLLLNANYVPLKVISTRAAVLLVLADKADMLESTGEEWRSPSTSVPVPSVLRLRVIARIPYRHRLALNRAALAQRDKGRCQYCGKHGNTVDHVVPRSKGGQHVWENVVLACSPCNQGKGDRLLSETNMRLARPPGVPHRWSWVTVAMAEPDPAWAPYLAVAH